MQKKNIILAGIVVAAGAAAGAAVYQAYKRRKEQCCDDADSDEYADESGWDDENSYDAWYQDETDDDKSNEGEKIAKKPSDDESYSIVICAPEMTVEEYEKMCREMRMCIAHVVDADNGIFIMEYSDLPDLSSFRTREFARVDVEYLLLMPHVLAAVAVKRSELEKTADAMQTLAKTRKMMT